MFYLLFCSRRALGDNVKPAVAVLRRAVCSLLTGLHDISKQDVLTNLSVVCTVSSFSCVHCLFVSRMSTCHILTLFVCCVNQNPSQRTHCRGRAWTGRKLGCPLMLGGDWSASCWRRTVTRWCPLASMRTDSVSSMWTTLKCRPHRRMHTRSSGKRFSWFFYTQAVLQSCQWYSQHCLSLQSQAELISWLLWRWERGADIGSAH